MPHRHRHRHSRRRHATDVYDLRTVLCSWLCRAAADLEGEATRRQAELANQLGTITVREQLYLTHGMIHLPLASYMRALPGRTAVQSKD